MQARRTEEETFRAAPSGRRDAGGGWLRVQLEQPGVLLLRRLGPRRPRGVAVTMFGHTGLGMLICRIAIAQHVSAETVPAMLASVHLGLVSIVVSEYDPAIRFFVDVLGFGLVEDSPALTNDGPPKRWVVVRPPDAQTGLLLARADGQDQAAVVGKQAAGRVGFFLHVEDFAAAYARMAAAGVQFLTAPRTEPYGQVAVFLDISGNKWDLIGP
jgi:catechol 2,3-dioxygenase-like lactoylglutathione lyase family enzyme